MDKPRVDKKAKTVEIKANSKKEFFLLHGYTGSPTDFNQLGSYLNKKFNANVKIIRLKGHGEKIENIDHLNYSDFLLQAETELKKDLKKGREIIIGGLSLGGFIALQLSVKYPVKGILCISLPYKYKFPMGVIAAIEPIIIKKHWKKAIPAHEKDLRKNAFFYDVHARGLRMIKQGKKEINLILNKVNAPCLIIHVAKEKLFQIKGSKAIKDNISSKIKEIKIFAKSEKEESSHNPFYSQSHERLYSLIEGFVKKNKLFETS